MLILFLRERSNLINLVFYSLLVIGPLSAFFGFDLIWENVHSLYTYKRELPVFSIIGIWLIGTLYYFKKNKTTLP
jgi:hypothetical protein